MSENNLKTNANCFVTSFFTSVCFWPAGSPLMVACWHNGWQNKHKMSTCVWPLSTEAGAPTNMQGILKQFIHREWFCCWQSTNSFILTWLSTKEQLKAKRHAIFHVTSSKAVPVFPTASNSASWMTNNAYSHGKNTTMPTRQEHNNMLTFPLWHCSYCASIQKAHGVITRNTSTSE